MKKSGLRTIWWTAVLIYLALVYATLGAAPGLWDRFNGALAGKGLAVVYASCLAAGVSVFTYMVFIKKERSFNNYFLFFLFVWVVLALNRLSRFPVDKVHLVEYGALSLLLYNALKIDFDRFDKKLYVLGSLFCLVAGFFDEAIQWFLPGRVFDWRDVILNVTSGATVLMVIRFNVLKAPPGSDRVVGAGWM
ncbi:MAG: VanZ family protein [Candidatus Omnitrophica bacterium]|nr:VanZ family protein [Candidatus Omnitrophota bacterium]